MVWVKDTSKPPTSSGLVLGDGCWASNIGQPLFDSETPPSSGPCSQHVSAAAAVAVVTVCVPLVNPGELTLPLEHANVPNVSLFVRRHHRGRERQS